MDVDMQSTSTGTTSYIAYFDMSPANFPFRDPRPEQIESRRAMLGDVLIYDIVLTSGGIREPDTLYPPRDKDSLERLLSAIENCRYDALKKDCLVYFLLKWYQDGREERFQEERCIPPQFSALANAYWFLDCGINIPRAVSILSDSRLNRDYASKIIQAITFAPNSAPLMRKYIRTSKPPLTEPDDLNIYTLALADYSLLEAWQFQRTFDEKDETRPRLFKKILEWCIIPQPRTVALTQLISLPLSAYEQSILNSYALDPPSSTPFSAVAVLQDLICVRLVQSGKYSDAIKLDRQFIAMAPNKNAKETQGRIKMMQDLYAAISPIERDLLDAELMPPAAQPIGLSNVRSMDEDLDRSISQSWQDIHSSDILPSYKNPAINLPPAPSIPETSGIPRFSNRIPPTKTTTPQKPPMFSGSSKTNNAFSALPPTVPVSQTSDFKKAAVPRTSLSGVANRMMMSIGSEVASSPITGMKVSRPSLTGSGHAKIAPQAFTSASKQHNAFYKPPPAKLDSTKPTFLQGGPGADENASVEEDDIQDERVAQNPGDRNARDKAAEGDAELQFSVFSDIAPTTTTNVASQPSRTRRKDPPGAYTSEDDNDETEKHTERHHQVSRTKRHHDHNDDQSKRAAKLEKIDSRKNRLRQSEKKKSLPGSLIDEDEEDEDDEIAPLRAASPPRRISRKARSTASSDGGDGEGEGVQTRRRSSRLSTNTNTRGGSAEPLSVGSKSRKPAKGSTTKRKG